MNCPRCHRETLTRPLKGVDVDVCEGCGGMFLDRGELNRIAEATEGDLEFSTLHGESYVHRDVYGPAVCPRCGDRKMQKVEFNIYTDIILDHCEECGGFWLDKGEIDRIDQEVRELDEAWKEAGAPPMHWFARFIWGLPR